MDINVARRAYLQATQLDASDKVMLALFEAGLVESDFENLSYGDRDSVGFLQQRPSAGWGTVEQCMNVEYATTSFVTRAQRIEDQYRSAGLLAQAVQISAYPTRYSLREGDARALIGRIEDQLMAGLYINDYRPWPDWVVEGNEEIALRFGAQIGTYRGHADGDPGHDMSGDLAADFFFYDNTKTKHDQVLTWFKLNAERIGATYIITWRRIWSVARASEGVRVYTGSDPHTSHIHVSYGTTPPEGDDELPEPRDVWIGAQVDFVRLPSGWAVGDDPVQPKTALEKTAAHVDALEKKVDAIIAALQPSPEV